MTYGDLIRQEREKKGLNLSQLERRSGVKRSTIRKWEEGNSEPNVRNFVKVLRALGIRAISFYAKEEKEEMERERA